MRRFITACLAAAASFALVTTAASASIRNRGSGVFQVDLTGIPTLQIGVGDTCDIQLEPGERIQKTVINDTTQWVATAGLVGNGDAAVPHLVLKPTAANLYALLTIFSDRRVYHIRMLSTNGPNMEYVTFHYPQPRRKPAPLPKADAPKALLTISTCRGLDDRYAYAGAKVLLPSAICNDGKHTFITIRASGDDLPLPYARDNGQDAIVNYSYDAQVHQYVLDGVPKEIVLVRGSGRGQLRTTLRRMS